MNMFKTLWYRVFPFVSRAAHEGLFDSYLNLAIDYSMQGTHLAITEFRLKQLQKMHKELLERTHGDVPQNTTTQGSTTQDIREDFTNPCQCVDCGGIEGSHSTDCTYMADLHGEHQQNQEG